VAFLAYHPRVSGPRFLYLHGFASGPQSSKGVAFSEHFARVGVNIERLNLRLPSLERLRLSAGMAAARAAIGGARDRAVMIGSSLGGLTAALAAAADPRVCALVLMAPAFRMVERWKARLGQAALGRWRETGWLEVDDYATRTRGRVDFGFLEDAAAVEAELDQQSGGWPDVRVPTLILHGRGDTVVDIATSRQFAAGKRHVRLVELDDGHELGASVPRLLDEAQRFLAGFLVPAGSGAA
jgi:pimeloyl-ACP methyl ester carboxylesterase